MPNVPFVSAWMCILSGFRDIIGIYCDFYELVIAASLLAAVVISSSLDGILFVFYVSSCSSITRARTRLCHSLDYLSCKQTAFDCNFKIIAFLHADLYADL